MQALKTIMTAPGHVVVVEDDFELRALLRDFLEALGYRVTEFPTAKAALEQLRNPASLGQEISGGAYPVIVSDNQMPEMDGMSFLKIVKHEMPDIPFILMTAFGRSQTEDEATRAGAFDFIRKPFALGQIDTALNKAFTQIRKSRP